jgi:hypothetical protein
MILQIYIYKQNAIGFFSFKLVEEAFKRGSDLYVSTNNTNGTSF